MEEDRSKSNDDDSTKEECESGVSSHVEVKDPKKEKKGQGHQQSEEDDNLSHPSGPLFKRDRKTTDGSEEKSQVQPLAPEEEDGESMDKEDVHSADSVSAPADVTSNNDHRAAGVQEDQPMVVPQAPPTSKDQDPQWNQVEDEEEKVEIIDDVVVSSRGFDSEPIDLSQPMTSTTFSNVSPDPAYNTTKKPGEGSSIPTSGDTTSDQTLPVRTH